MLDILQGDGRAALVITALAANPVRDVRLAAVGAGDEAWARERVMRAALVSARPRRLLLWYGHENTSWLLLAYCLEPRDGDAVETPPARVDLVIVILRLHRFRARQKDLHRHLGRQDVLRVARQIEGPVLD
jgi:hypothetical protein